MLGRRVWKVQTKSQTMLFGGGDLVQEISVIGGFSVELPQRSSPVSGPTISTFSKSSCHLCHDSITHTPSEQTATKMPGQTPITYPLIASPLPSRPYILDIHRLPSASADHLILRHPAPELGVADAQTLQLVHTLSGGHVGNVSSVSVDAETGALWSAGKDARAVRWDERGRGAGMRIDGESSDIGELSEHTML